MKQVHVKIGTTTAVLELSAEFSGTQEKELKGKLRKFAKVIVTEPSLGGWELVRKEYFRY